MLADDFPYSSHSRRDVATRVEITKPSHMSLLVFLGFAVEAVGSQLVEGKRSSRTLVNTV